MMRKQLLCALAGLVLASGVAAGEQEKGAWRPANSTAQDITGDVAFSEDRIAINFASFAIARIRDLGPDEVSAAFDVDRVAAGSGSLYRLNIPASKVFMHKNSLCGGEDTQWMAAYAAGHSLHLVFFSGPKMPVFTPEAFANSTDLCGAFAYVR